MALKSPRPGRASRTERPVLLGDVMRSRKRTKALEFDPWQMTGDFQKEQKSHFTD